MNRVTLRTRSGRIEIQEHNGRITIQTYDTPHQGSSRHLKQMMRDPEKLVMASMGVMSAPGEQEAEHRWGHQGVPSEIDGLVRVLRRAGAMHLHQQDREQQQAEEMLFAGLDAGVAEEICPEWLGKAR